MTKTTTAQPPTEKPRTGQALLAVLGVNVIYGPFYLWGIFTMLMRMNGHDSTGHGGILKSCYTNGPGCVGPNYFMVALGFLVIIAGFFLAGYAGAKVGRYTGRDFDKKLLIFTVVSIPLGGVSLLGAATGLNPLTLFLAH